MKTQSIEQLLEGTWNKMYPERSPWKSLHSETKKDWIRVFTIYEQTKNMNTTPKADDETFKEVRQCHCFLCNKKEEVNKENTEPTKKPMTYNSKLEGMVESLSKELEASYDVFERIDERVKALEKIKEAACLDRDDQAVSFNSKGEYGSISLIEKIRRLETTIKDQREALGKEMNLNVDLLVKIKTLKQDLNNAKEIISKAKPLIDLFDTTRAPLAYYWA